MVKATKAENVFNQLYQKNSTLLLGYRLRLNLYNSESESGFYISSSSQITSENTKENQNGCQQNR
jgi:hypothetical protein